MRSRHSLDMESLSCPSCPPESNGLLPVKKSHDPVPKLHLSGRVNEDVQTFLDWALALEAVESVEKSSERVSSNKSKAATSKAKTPSAKQAVKSRRSRFAKMEA